MLYENLDHVFSLWKCGAICKCTTPTYTSRIHQVIPLPKRLMWPTWKLEMESKSTFSFPAGATRVRARLGDVGERGGGGQWRIFFELLFWSRPKRLQYITVISVGSLDAQVGGEEAGSSSGGAVGGAAPGADAEVAREVAVALNILSTSVWSFRQQVGLRWRFLQVGRRGRTLTAEHITSITLVSWQFQMREHRLEVKMLQHELHSGNILVLVEKQGEEERRAGRGTSTWMKHPGTHFHPFSRSIN